MYIYTHIHTYLYVRVHVCVFVLPHASLDMYEYISRDMHVCMHKHTHARECTHTHTYISRIQSYLLVKIAHRFLSENSQIYVDPRGVAWGPTPSSHMRHPRIRCHGDTPGSHSWFLAHHGNGSWDGAYEMMGWDPPRIHVNFGNSWRETYVLS